jgi:prolyl oligopeptidase
MDMVRFTEFTVGAAWKSDYGDPKDPADFKACTRTHLCTT